MPTRSRTTPAPATLRLQLPGNDAAPTAAPPTRKVEAISRQRVVLQNTRDAGGSTLVEAAPDDVVRIDLGDQIVLWSRADDLLRERGQPAATGRGGAASTTWTLDTSAQPQRLDAPALQGAQRGALGLGIQALEFFGVDLKGQSAALLGKQLETLRLKGHAPGLYRLTLDDAPPTFTAIADGRAVLPPKQPVLVFLHGTMSNALGSFGELWSQEPGDAGRIAAEARAALKALYGEHVYAFEHRSLSESPVANALALARHLPADAELHLVSHSRGGLVGELLCLGQRDNAGQPGRDAIEPGLLKTLFAAEAEAAPQMRLGLLAPAAAGERQAAYDEDRERVLALVQVLDAQRTRVSRFVRVACPARGTTLASGRLDRWLSVISLIAGDGLAGDITDFLLAVVKERTDPRTLPGLEAMMPGSALTRLLQWPALVTRADLSAITSDLEPQGRWGKLKLLAVDWFYAGDHDLVVNTGSMAGGLRRPDGGARFRHARGPEVNHFRYFANAESLRWMVSGLSRVDGNDAGFQPIALAPQAEPASRAAMRASRAGAANKPAAIVVPGTMGSALRVGGQRVWLNYFTLMRGGLGDIGIDAVGVEPDSLLDDFYGPLLSHLSQTHAVYPVAYDWRRSVREAAKLLTAQLETVLIDAEKNRQPVRIVAHSMGGLVARAMIADGGAGAAAWRRMIALPQSRLLMLGTPNRGSYEAVRWLTGFNPTEGKLTLLDLTRGANGIIDIVRRYPGLAELLPFDTLAGERDFADPALWQALRAQLQAGFPPAEAAALSPARGTWQLLQHAAIDPEHMLYVAGEQPATVIDYAVQDDAIEGSGKPQLQFIATPDGDGTVPWASGRLDGVPAYRAPDTAHDDLCANTDDPRIFRGYVELLQSGRTDQLPTLAAAGSRAGLAADDHARRFALPPEPAPDSLPDEATLQHSGFGARSLRAAPVAAPGSADAALKITLRNGDLKFVGETLMVGHYSATRLTGTERVVDALVGGAMHESLQAGLYPEAPGTQQIFRNRRPDPINPKALPRPQAVVVAGLGEEGKLKVSDLVMSVRQAVIAYAQRRLETEDGADQPFELAATLIGSGGTGMSAGSAAQAIAMGVREANRRLAACQGGGGAAAGGKGWPRVSHLHLVELYLERAGEAWQGLRVQAESLPGQFELSPRIQFGAGAIRRPIDSTYRGTSYDFISAVAGAPEPVAPPATPADADADGGAAPPCPAPEPTIAYTLDTRRARTEVRAQATQGRLLKELVRTASNEANHDPGIGRALFKLLIPAEMEPFLGGGDEHAGNDLVIELDDSTAGIPWELLDTQGEPAGGGAGTATPWAIRTKLLRKLRSIEFRKQVHDARADDDILVIGEPLADPALYGPLPGARAEARAVLQLLTGPAGVDAARVRALIAEGDGKGPGNRAVISALLERDYRVVHIAGHGEASMHGGVVLSNKTFLGPREIEAMRKVPELVFLNCCHLARDDSRLLQPGFDRSAFAASVAKQLIRIGVRCVIAAGWAVEDAPAELFAARFYQALLAGEPFIAAVAIARREAWSQHRGSNTWAAYQCYGDPDWRWRQRTGDAQAPTGPAVDEFAGIASPVGLCLALENLLTQVKYQDYTPARQVQRIQSLDARFAPHWGGMGAVAEAFGLAYAECGQDDKALAWLVAAVAAPDGSASLRAAEQQANVRVRSATSAAEIDGAIKLMQQLGAIQPSVERATLLGSAYKRLTLIEAARGRGDASRAALEKAVQAYAQAEQIAVDSAASNPFYPAMNRLAAQARLAIVQRQPIVLDALRLAAIRDALARKALADPDFWSVAGQTELAVLEALAQGRLAGALPAVLASFSELHQRVAAPHSWASVYEHGLFLLRAYELSEGRDANEASAAASLLQALAGFAGKA